MFGGKCVAYVAQVGPARPGGAARYVRAEGDVELRGEEPAGAEPGHCDGTGVDVERRGGLTMGQGGEEEEQQRRVILHFFIKKVKLREWFLFPKYDEQMSLRNNIYPFRNVADKMFAIIFLRSTYSIKV